MFLYYTVWVCWSGYVCVEDPDPKWPVITLWWKKIYILMLMKCMSLSCQTFNVATKCNSNFARSPTSNFSEFALWNSWCVKSKPHVFFSFFGLVASKTCTGPSVFKTHCNTPVFLQCECLAYIWGGWGVKMSTEFKFWNNYLFGQLLF